MADLGPAADVTFNSVLMIFTVKEPVLSCLDQEPGSEARFSQHCPRGSPAVSAGMRDGGDPTDTDCPQHLSGKNREPLWIPIMDLERSLSPPPLSPAPFSSLQLFKLSLAFCPFPFHFLPPLPHHHPQDRLPGCYGVGACYHEMRQDHFTKGLVD